MTAFTKTHLTIRLICIWCFSIMSTISLLAENNYLQDIGPSSQLPSKEVIEDLKTKLVALSSSELLGVDTLIESFHYMIEYLPNNSMPITALSCKGMYYFETSQFAKAQAVFKDLLLKEKQEDNWSEMAIAHNYLAILAEFDGRLTDVYKHNKALLRYGEQYHPVWAASVCLNLGSLYFKLKDYEGAKQMYQNGLTIFKDIPKSVEFGWLLHRFGELYTFKKEYPLAQAYLIKARDYWTRIYNNRAFCFTVMQLGDIEVALNNYEQAAQYYAEVLKCSKENNFWLSQVKVFLALGKLEYSKGNFKQAIQCLESSIELSVEKDIPYHFKESYEMLAKTYNKAGLIDKANLTYQSYLDEIEKSLQENEKVARNWVASEDELEVRAKEVQQLRAIEVLSQEKMNLQQNIIIGSSFILLLFIGIAYRFFQKNQRIKAQKERLLVLNQQIQQKSTELETAHSKLETAHNNILQQKNTLEVELVKKLMMLSKQVEAFDNLQGYIDKMPQKTETDALKRIIAGTKDDSIWEELDLQISHANSDFFERLSKQFDTLSQSDLRLCALLKMNLRTKEIANLTFRNPESVKVARSRLRKKLGLTHTNTSLPAFLNQV